MGAAPVCFVVSRPMDPQLLHILWILICAGEVMLMQLGFCMLESGLVRTKNSINVAVKNIADFFVAAILYLLFGYALMFGDSIGGWIGVSGFALTGAASGFDYAFFLFQLVFCATAATIVSGAVAERMSFKGYLLVSALVSGIIYPLNGHWIWGEGGWLAALGYVDFAGSTAVHAVGGFFALAAVIIIGPRLGRFQEGYRLASAHSLVIATFGVIVLFFGWLGFNGGSLLAFTDAIPLILLNTAMAGAAGGFAGLLVSWRYTGFPELRDILNGVIAGLVSVTACCHVVSVLDSVLLGAIGGLIAYLASRWLIARRIDDVVGASAAHGFPGIWGVLCVPLFGDPVLIGTGLGFWEQLGVQALGAATMVAWAFGVGWILVKALDAVFPLRISAEQERVGLNVAEHGATTELLDLLEEMGRHRERGDFTRPVQADPFTEVGQIAREYNSVIARVAAEMAQREEIASRLRKEKTRTESINREILSSIEYAERIQAAVLPDCAQLDRLFPQHGLLFRPRDIVSGDFYWLHETTDARFAAVVDCTGHGVPGAFMSLIGSTMLTDIVRAGHTHDPARILEQLHRALRRSLRQDAVDRQGESMDIALVVIEENQILFAGARRPLYVLSSSGATYHLSEYKGDRKSVGGRQRDRQRRFTTHTIPREADMRLFLTSDGFADQANAARRPLDTSRLKQWLEAHADEPVDRHVGILAKAFDQWREGTPQRDDVTIWGLRLDANGRA